MHCKATNGKVIEFISKLGFKQHDITMSKEQSVTTKTIKLFPNEKILLQHSVLRYKIDFHFSKHKLAIEVDEKKEMKIEILTMRYKYKKQQKKNLIVSLLELILIEKIMKSMLNLVK